MDEPEVILQKIMQYEQTLTPQFNNLIKQSLIANVDIDDDPENDIYPQLPDAPPPPQTRKSVSDSAIATINDHTHSIESLLSSSISTNKRKPKAIHPGHEHKPTPIMSRAGIDPSPIKMIDVNSFLITDDIEYHSQEDEEDDFDRNSSEEDEFEEDKPQHPLIEEYDDISHQIHVLKIKLRKLDRQMTMAARMEESQSEFVKKYSDLKIKIAQLISKRRKLEMHDIIREHLKDEEVDTVEIDVQGTEMMELNDGLMEINEDEEEEDEEEDEEEEEEEKEVVSNNNMHITPNTSDGLDVFDYSYDAEIVLKEDDDEDHLETGSVEIHSDEEDDDDDGSVKYHSSEEEEANGSVQLHSSEEDNNGSVEVHSSTAEEDQNTGSVQLHSSDEHEANGGGSVEIHSSEGEEDNNGSVQLHSSEESNNGSVELHSSEEVGGGSVQIYSSEEEEEESDGAGSMQMNDDVEQTENWVDEDFDTKSLEIHDSDEEEEEKKYKIEAKVAINENINDNIPHSPVPQSPQDVDARTKRLEQMKRHRSYKEYGDNDDADFRSDANNELDALQQKYQDSRRNREQISEIEQPFSMNDLLMKGEEDNEQTQNALNVFRDNMSHEHSLFANNIKENEEDDYDEDESSSFEELPFLPEKQKSVLLDICQLSAKLADIVEEEWSEDEAEGKFQAVEYETNSDCDSNDSIVVKKEIVKNVTVDELAKFDSV